MVIVEDGEPCQGACTGRGHVESYCSGHAADRLARERARARARLRATSSSNAIRRSSEIGHHLGRRDRVARQHLRSGAWS